MSSLAASSTIQVCLRRADAGRGRAGAEWQLWPVAGAMAVAELLRAVWSSDGRDDRAAATHIASDVGIDGSCSVRCGTNPNVGTGVLRIQCHAVATVEVDPNCVDALVFADVL